MGLVRLVFNFTGVFKVSQNFAIPIHIIAVWSCTKKLFLKILYLLQKVLYHGPDLTRLI